MKDDYSKEFKDCGWQFYIGIYEKQHYDIQLWADGEIIENCWPNAGTFHDMKGKIYDGKEVYAIRPSGKKPFDILRSMATDK